MLKKENQNEALLRNCYLSIFASLFADRHGCIYNLSNNSIPSSFLLSLYSGFNKVLLDKPLLTQYEPIIHMNSLDKQVHSDFTQSIHTIVLYTSHSSQ